MLRKRTRARSGFSLIELLVVIAVMGILMSLLLAAVQRVREAAQRAACANNLRQIGIGCHSYHDNRKTFPPGGIERRSAKYPKGRQLAWSAFLLPYIEQNLLYDRLDLRQAFDSQRNAPMAATVIATYVCPSVPRASYLSQGRGVIDYGGIYGERISRPNEPPRGAMIYERAISIGDVTDGTACTLMISEDCGSPDAQWINALNVFDQAFAINQAPAFENDIRSKHPGGANGVFCDGSARFLNEDMALQVLAAMCTRNGGELLTDF